MKPKGEPQPAVEAFEKGSGVKVRSHVPSSAREILAACGCHRADGETGSCLVAGEDVLPFIQRAAASWVRATPDPKYQTVRNFVGWLRGLHRRDVMSLIGDGLTAADKLVTHFATKYQEAFGEPYIQSPKDHHAAAQIVTAARVAAQRDNRWTDGAWAAHWQAWHLQHTSERKCLDRLRMDVENRQAEMKTPGSKRQATSQPPRGRHRQELQIGVAPGSIHEE